jgi:hypothetical protein
MSIAHVFGQDNKHVPETVMAQDVQEEMTAELPPSSQPITNVPQPPAVAGFKQTPNKGAPGSVPPGQLPNSGDTKTNQKNQHAGAGNITAPSGGNSAAGNSAFTDEGQNRIKRGARESAVVQRAIYTVLLREAVQPLVSMRTALARYILDDVEAVKEFERAVNATEEGRIYEEV